MPATTYNPITIMNVAIAKLYNFLSMLIKLKFVYN